jgi:hypothetical protein
VAIATTTTTTTTIIIVILIKITRDFIFMTVFPEIF